LLAFVRRARLPLRRLWLRSFLPSNLCVTQLCRLALQAPQRALLLHHVWLGLLARPNPPCCCWLLLKLLLLLLWLLLRLAKR
jgi:hypothetical protein